MSWSSPSVSSVRPYIFAPLDLPLPATPVVDLAEDEVFGHDAPLGVVIDIEAERQAARAEGFERGHTAGFEQGYAEGLAAAQSEQAAVTGRLTALVEGALGDADGYMRTVERGVVELALAIARKVIEREAATDPEIVLGVVRGALAELQESAEVHVRVSPDDYPLVAGHWEGLLRRPIAGRSSLIPDDNVERGSCVVQTATGEADARLSTKLDQIAKTFGALLEGELA